MQHLPDAAQRSPPVPGPPQEQAPPEEYEKTRKGDDPTQSLGAQTRKPGAQKVIEESQGLNKLVKKADVDDNFAF